MIKLAVGFIAYGESTGKYLPQFYPSLKQSLLNAEADFKLWCWDNNPRNDINKKWLNKNAPEVSILESSVNLGFAKSANKLINLAVKAEADYYLLVNPDTCWDKEAVKNLLATLEADKKLGSVSPKILFWDYYSDRRTRRIDTLGLKKLSGLRFIDLHQGQIDRGFWDKSRILGPSGAAAMFRLKALESISFDGQYFDERFFMYKEDCDLAMRLKLKKWPSKLVPKAKVWHDRTARTQSNSLFGRLSARTSKSSTANEQSLYGQLLLIKKYWRYENLWGWIKIFFGLVLKFIFTILFERNLLSVWNKSIKK